MQATSFIRDDRSTTRSDEEVETRVRLLSRTGATVELAPASYQFGPAAEPREWDANWLIIRAHVVLANGRSWSFADPCLTTWEARQLTSWLEGVVAGEVMPFEFDGGEDERLLMFTEPVVAFSLADRVGATVTLRVHLSLDARPPWDQDHIGDDDVDLFDDFVELEMPVDALAAATAAWDEELSTFPIR
jgi:hypothetical protein